MIRLMNSNLINNLLNFLKNRSLELVGLALIASSILLSISFISYSPNDPSFVYGESNNVIKNFLGIYGSTISDFLLQSFGLVSFLFLVTLISWGFTLIHNKNLNNLITKIFFVVLYLLFGSTFLYIFNNNSFWLVDNGNSGFVGQTFYNLIYNYFPIVESQYTSYGLIVLTIVFFILGSNISIKLFLFKTLNLFKRIDIKSKISNYNTNNDTSISEVNDPLQIENPLEKNQQSFIFEKDKQEQITRNRAFKLPSLDLLEKSKIQINSSEINKSRPDPQFIEKVLLDFGIEGKIKKINNGPVVSLYEFEPAPGIKVSKIINLTDDIARNTSSVSVRVSVIPGNNTVGIEIPNETREEVVLREIISNDKFQT